MNSMILIMKMPIFVYYVTPADKRIIIWICVMRSKNARHTKKEKKYL